MFKKFPEFTKLTLGDKEIYEKFVYKYPPYSDLLFSTLNIWWDIGHKLAVSILNKNLVINYHSPFDEKNSGYSLIGTHRIYTSIGEIFDFQKRNKITPKLVHIPQFVINAITDTKEFLIHEEDDYSEYILNVRSLAEIKGKDHENIRYKVNRFIRETQDKQVELAHLDLSKHSNRLEILNFFLSLEKSHPSLNDLDHSENIAIRKTLDFSSDLGIKAFVIYIDGKLSGVSLHDEITDKKYYVGHHLKVDYGYTGISEFFCHKLAQYLLDSGMEFMNIEMDLGIENLRKHKMSMRPVAFLKKYTIENK